MYHPGLGRFVERDPVEADINLYRYCTNSPTIHVDPSGLFTVNGPRGYTPVGTGSGMPNSSTTGGMFVISRQPNDGPYFIQDVSVDGTLLCETGNGYNVVGFAYSWTEVWPFDGMGIVRDTHTNSPAGAASFVNNKCACPCDFTKPWSFTATAEFVAYAGTVSPLLYTFSFTLVEAVTTYRCAGAGDEGTTLEGNDALMDMYPGKRGSNPAGPTGLSRRTLTRLGNPGYDVDSWVCTGSGSWTCRYTSTGYHARGASPR